MRTLNLGCGRDRWGTDRLDWKDYNGDAKSIKIFDLNSKKRLPYPDGVFSEIRFHALIQALLYPQEILEECNRVLEPGGRLDLTFLDCEWILYFIFPIRDKKVRFGKSNADNGKTYGIWNAKMMSNRLEAAGFKVQKTTKVYEGILNTQRLVNIIAIKQK